MGPSPASILQPNSPDLATPLPRDPLAPRHLRVPLDEIRQAWQVQEGSSSGNTVKESLPHGSTRSLPSSDRLEVSPSFPVGRQTIRDSHTGTAQSVDLIGPFEARSENDVRRLRRMIVSERRRTGSPVEDVVARVMSRQDIDKPAVVPPHEELLTERQTAAQQECYTGNENLACYPTNTTDVSQGTWGKFIWNKNYPFFTNGGGYVDIYLFHQDSDQLFTSWMSVPNDQGRISFEPTDTWWAGRPAANNIQEGQTISWPFYFAITSHGAGLSDGTSRLATWHAIQTAVPATVAAARASSSSASLASAASASSAAAASASSINTLTATLTGAALSSASASLQSASDAAASRSLAGSLSGSLQSSLNSEGLTGTETAQGTATSVLPDGHTVTAYATAQANGGNLNNNGGGSNTAIPHWAIVLIAVLGFLAVVAAIVAGYFLTRWLRRRRGGWAAGAAGAAGGFGAGRMAASGSHGSQSPMIQAAGAAGEDDGADGNASLLDHADGGSYASHDGAAATGVGAGAGAAVAAGASSSRRPRPSDRSSQTEEESPFSTDEASRMAEAFRAALRKPAFALGLGGLGGSSNGNGSSSPPSHTGDSGATAGDRSSTTNAGGNGPSDALLRDELASEGREMRSVDDRRRPSLHQPQ